MEPTVFISYSHQDEVWKDRLIQQLGVLQRQGILSAWSDREIPGGDPWEEQIQKAMDRSCIAVLLISPHFLNSDFILTREVPHLLQQREKRGLRIFPVVLDPVDLQAVDWLRPLQCRPKDAQPLSTFRRPQAEENLATIAKEIRLLVAGAKPRPEGGPPAVPPQIAAANLPATGQLFVGRQLDLDLWEAEAVILAHLSRRTNLVQAREHLEKLIGDEQLERVHILMDHRMNRQRYERQLAELNGGALC